MYWIICSLSHYAHNSMYCKWQTTGRKSEENKTMRMKRGVLFTKVFNRDLQLRCQKLLTLFCHVTKIVGNHFSVATALLK